MKALRSKLNPLCAMAVGIVGLWVVGDSAAQVQGVDRWSQLSTANNLAKEGAAPFHLKMTFQLYDLAGKPGEAGTIEEWWSSPTSKRLIVTAPSLEADGKSLSDDSPSGARESYLVAGLLEAVSRPMPQFGKLQFGTMAEETKAFGKIQLSCMTPQMSGHNPLLSGLPTVCTEANTDVVRFLSHPMQYETLVRNVVGQFHGVNVAQAIEVSMMDLSAISGKVTRLEAFDPVSIGSEVKTPDGEVASTPPGLLDKQHMAGGVIAGHVTKWVDPIYPAQARMQRLNGVVLVHIVISKEGNATKPFPLAASNAAFIDAAVESVRQSKYSPFLLNGAPTEAETFVTVNFHL